MPEVRLDAADATELAEMLQFLSQWLAQDPGRLGASLTGLPATPPMAWANCAATWSGSPSCSAAATASSSSAHDAGRPPRPAEATPGRAGLNVVRPRAGALRALIPLPSW